MKGQRRTVLLITVVSAALYTAHAVVRQLTFHSTAYDLGFFDQLVSNLSAGRGWNSSFISYDFRGQHWEPILLAIVPLYRVAQSPLWLLGINGVALGLAPWAAWRLARRWLGDDHPGAVAAAVVTALNPLVLRTAGFDYHSEALTPLLALIALEAASRRRWLVTGACCAVMLFLKEDALLVVAGVGWIIWCVEHRRRGLLLAAAALGGFVFLVGVYMPGLRAGHGSDLLARYAYLANGASPVTPGAVLAGLVTQPGTWLAHLGSGAALAGLAVAFLPLALLPLISGWSLLAPLPPLLLALLSSDPLQAALQFHYGIEAFPLLLACALLGWRRLASLRRPRVTQRPVLAVLVGVTVLAVPLAVDLRGRVADVAGLGRVAAVRSLLGHIPGGAPVSASSDLVAQLSERAAITEFPDVRGATWVVIDAQVQPSVQALAAGYRTALARLPSSFHLVSTAAGVSLWERA